jgi:DNA recombination protein RmuC
MPLYFIYITLALLTSLIGFTLLHFYKLERQHDKLIQMESRWTDINRLLNQLHDARVIDQRHTAANKEQLLLELNTYRQQFDRHQLSSLKLLQDSLQQGLQTTATFADVVKRLALIDEAQKRITELSSNVVNLQQILADKRSRGVFGEVQLNALIENVLPAKNYSLQHTLSNGKRVDCLLLLPAPTGSIAIDAKFPLEGFRKLTEIDQPKSEQRAAAAQFRQDIRHHIQAVASKYIIPGETSEGALLFIPAEAIFAEIHAHYYDLVEEAQRQRVWLVSPTTMMAVLTTTSAILKDAATREQIHLIQEHLSVLAKDFSRFKQRMDHLFRHIQQAYTDIQDAKTSADKITSRFEKIEKVELSADLLE